MEGQIAASGPRAESTNPLLSSVTSGKRKRSPSEPPNVRPTAPAANMRAQPSHVQINYLARSNYEDLPLVTEHDTLPGINALIDRYEEVLQRHESMAANFGATPLSQVLIKRFVRMFDGPVKVLHSNTKGHVSTDWLDIVDFANTHPAEFNEAEFIPTKNATRVCHFWVKQTKVEITEDDHTLIASGIPQKMIPPQPIDEDEEKEQLTLEILEKNLTNIIALTDAVSGKSRQLKHRLIGRRNAINSRRSTKPDHSPAPDAARTGRPSASQPNVNGSSETNGQRSAVLHRESSSPSAGFVAVNNRDAEAGAQVRELNAGYPFSNSGPSPSQVISGIPQRSGSITKTKEEMRAELMKKFVTTTEASQTRRPSTSITAHHKKPSIDSSRPPIAPARRQSHRDSSLEANDTQTSPVVFGTSSAKPAAIVQSDDGGPFRQEMARRVEQLARYESIFPPCDRCRRLSVTCTKNLTACQGCTRKHAKCCWKDVQEEEMTMPVGERVTTNEEMNHDSENTPEMQDERRVRRRGHHEDELSDKGTISDRASSARPGAENDLRGSRATTHASPGSLRDAASPSHR